MAYLFTVKMYETFRRFGDEYYPAYRIFLGAKGLIIIRHPDDLEVPNR